MLHARSADRAGAIGELASRAEGIVVGDLQSAAETRSIADQVNSIGRMDAIIHNAGIYAQRTVARRLRGMPARLRSTLLRRTC